MLQKPHEELRIRQRLLEAAIEDLARHQYSDSLLKKVTDASGFNRESIATYFQSSRDIVIALYSRFTADLEARVTELPQGTLAERFEALMRIKFETMEPYRLTVTGLSKILAGRNGNFGVFSAETEAIRTRVQSVIAETIEGASDRPADLPRSLELITGNLYSIYLAIMWLWSKDNTGRKAERTLQAACRALSFSAPYLSGRAMSIPLRLGGLVQNSIIKSDPKTEVAATEILRILFRHRRMLSDDEACNREPCSRCFAFHLPKTVFYVAAGRPLHLILPAFPAKSPNRRKTLGPLPDMAEEQALIFLAEVCEQIRNIYPPGVRITICSDGHVFSDLVGVSDPDVTVYGNELSAMVARLGISDMIDTFSLSDLFENVELPEMRVNLNRHYEQSIESIKERAAKFPQAGTLINGIHRFLFEDNLEVDPARSRTQVRNECRSLAYRVVQRSDGWGRLLSDCFPMALRLSIHPQGPHSDKIGILLGRSVDVWLTPWHSVAVKKDGEFTLMKRHEAEAAGAKISGDGRYYEF